MVWAKPKDAGECQATPQDEEHQASNVRADFAVHRVAHVVQLEKGGRKRKPDDAVQGAHVLFHDVVLGCTPR